MALTELTLDQWAAARRTPGRVMYINDASLTDVMYRVAGSPGVLVINLANYADLVDGKVAGAAIDADSLEAGQIAAGAVDTSELADDAVTGVKIVDDAIGSFDLAAAQVVDHLTSPQELLALDATIDRVVLVRAVCTEAAVGSEIDVGSAGVTDSCFNDIGGGAYAIGDKFQGMCLVEAGANLRATVNVAGTAGAFNMYVTVVTPLVQEAQIADLAITNAKVSATAAIVATKLATPPLDDPGHMAQGVLRISGNAAVTDTVTIGADVFELDDITGVSGDTCLNGDWNNTDAACIVDMNVVDYANIGVGGGDPLQVGDLVFVGAEYMRVTVIGTPGADDVTFSRGRCGTAAAAHVDTTAIFIATTPHVANITIGSQAGGGAVIPGTFTPLLVATINDEDGTAGESNDVNAVSLAAGAIMLITADAVGAVVLATTETGGNLDWDDTAMSRGAVAGRRQVYAADYTALAAEAGTTIYVPLPFVPTQFYYSVLRGNAIIVWDGTVDIVAATPPMPVYLLLTDGGAAPVQTGDIISILAIE